MKILITLVTLCLTLSCAAQVDPFGGHNDTWAMQVRSEKPYDLEIRYGEVPAPLPKGKVSFISGLTTIPSPEFLASAKKIDAAVSEVDQGILSVTDGAEVFYKIGKEKDSFSIHILLSVLEGGKRSINTNFTIPENEWIILGGLSRESNDSKRYFYAAIRIQKKG